MILRRGEEPEAWRKFHGAELNEREEFGTTESISRGGTAANRGSKQNFSTVISSVALSPFDSIRFDSIPSSKDRLLLPLPEEKRKGDEEEREREREKRRRRRERREDGSLKSLVRFIYREKERRLSGDRFIEQRPVSGSASD